jgi:hypothetical protein
MNILSVLIFSINLLSMDDQDSKIYLQKEEPRLKFLALLTCLGQKQDGNFKHEISKKIY